MNELQAMEIGGNVLRPLLLSNLILAGYAKQVGSTGIAAVPSVRDGEAGVAFVVNSTADSDDGVCGQNLAAGQDCTLREAINAANTHVNSPGARDFILFAIPGSGIQTISAYLPIITDPVILDGYTQPGAQRTLSKTAIMRFFESNWTNFERRMKVKQRKFSLDTRLKRDYGVSYPFVCAGMAFVGTPPLAAAVANAGGIGMLGAATEGPPGVIKMIEQTRAMTDKLFGVNFIVDDTAFGPMTTDAHVEVCAAAGVRLVTFHWNPPEKRWVEMLHLVGTKVWFQTGLVEQARESLAAGVDGIIAQGSEAGGHVRAIARTMQTLEEILEAVPKSTIVLAAGGIADGRDVANAIAHGADGVWVGTRLLASSEANAHAEYKRRLVQAKGSATEHTTLFGPEWPAQRIHVLRNRVVNEWNGRENEIPSPPPLPAIIGQTLLMPYTVDGGVPYEIPKFSAMLPTANTTGDFEEMCMPAGEGVKLIKEIKPAAEIVEEMMWGARAIMAGNSISAG